MNKECFPSTEPKKFNSSCNSLLVSIVTEVPRHEFLQPCLQIRGRLISKFLLSITNICVCIWNIPVAWKLHNIPFSLNLQKPFQNTDKISNWHRRCIPQIENPQLCRPFLLPSTPGTLLCCIQRTQTTLHNIINVGKIPSNSPVIRSQ
ncbi:hypothetical protein POPTR_002G116750v4 [Populus trichocarpa]|uniref:Uncharacterized protein n=1 Tax=Populus trichocarpa TaxID=3694 RepID=A0ACC0TDF9_POPTR|nr:hypothetical protein BDE02_02G107800 [Populus trichocarpa]KAI9399580.1 hypothetical protein POPTR_002G116750v4 [Populus trichocarpa]